MCAEIDVPAAKNDAQVCSSVVLDVVMLFLVCGFGAGADRCVLGPELPFRRAKRQDSGRHRGWRLPTPGGVVDPHLPRGANASLAYRR